MAIRMPRIAMTIISSMRVKPCCFFMVYPLGVVIELLHVPTGPDVRSFGSRACRTCMEEYAQPMPTSLRLGLGIETGSVITYRPGCARDRVTRKVSRWFGRVTKCVRLDFPGQKLRFPSRNAWPLRRARGVAGRKASDSGDGRSWRPFRWVPG